MTKEKIYREFRVEKPSNSSQYEDLYITVMVSMADDREGALIRFHWLRDKQAETTPPDFNYRWFGKSVEIEQKNAQTFGKLLAKHISPMITKMDALGLLSDWDEGQPLKVCEFLDKQKIPQIVWYGGEKLFLKDIRSNNMFAVRDLQYPSQRPYIVIADSPLDAKYRLKERIGRYSDVESLDRFESKQLDMYEYKHLFDEGWRVACAPPKKKESE